MVLILSSPNQNDTNEHFYETIKEHNHDPKFVAKNLKLTDASNISIPISYFIIGFLSSFITTPITVYMVESIDASAVEQNTVTTLMSLPWSFKLVYGFLSDIAPIAGLRRKPYFLFGYFLNCLAFAILAMSEEPEYFLLANMIFLATVGQIMGDVMADTLVVERARMENTESRGQLQASCYAIRFAGTVFGYLFGTVLYNKSTWGWGLDFQQVCLLCSILPLIGLGGTVWSLYEAPARPKSIKEQFSDIWETACLKAVWKPMTFIFFFNCLQVPNIAWSSYLQLSLGFEAYMLGIIYTGGALMSLIGILAYKKFLFNVSWRTIYLYTTMVTLVFNLMQLVLIFQWNKTYLNMSNLWFAFGDDAVAEYVQGVQFLPVCIMFLRLCPDGSEGATYAILTTFSNIALNCGYNIGTLLSDIWDVSNDTLTAQDYSGFWKLDLLTGCLAPIPLALLFLLPKNKQDQEVLIKQQKKSTLGGTVFLTVLTISLAW
eukprot:CAMPEP_0171461766 /NCGR_PEP_ID=MMETSP0945-20130129/6080_1 /TAXON_ID=109269 /ORGANISM="Vaucheria litorea, Strain CCMP2940" /LENGTH=487 /DNA_ID=CAMNT_0011988173 /DNA_START=115 /DNA_END=1575 /DNA_ORIENTATION=+